MTRAGMKIRRALRLVGWNMLFLVAGLVLIGVVGEMYFRLRAPFGETFRPHAWSPMKSAVRCAWSAGMCCFSWRAWR